MTNINQFRLNSKYLLIGLIILSSIQIFAEGTKEVMPNSASGTALRSMSSVLTGSYYNCPADQRINFHIKDSDSETFYFGLNAQTRVNDASGTNSYIYYRIMGPGGSQEVGPTRVPTSGNGFINDYDEVNNGPHIGGLNPDGYSPLSFTPPTNGEYWIEVYRSFNGTSNISGYQGEVYFVYFDFSVYREDPNSLVNTAKTGRVYSKAWNFLAYNPGTFVPSITSSFEGDYYGYTADSAVNRIEFADGFNPFGFVLQMNSEGVGNSGDFTLDRQSQYQGLTAPVIENPFKVFLNEPDTSIFKVAAEATQPVITGNIYGGCNSSFFIPYYINKTGDVAILLDFNSIAGYQPNTSDRVLEAFNVSAGSNVMEWDGKNGLNVIEAGGTPVSIIADIYRGRTNIPIYDAEYNINGLSVFSIYPNTGVRPIYWDDTKNMNSSGSSCGNGDQNGINYVPGGIAVTNHYEGILGKSHPWNGSYPGTTKPAAANGGGNATTTTCDDFGNARVINTWFWADNVQSDPVVKLIPTCTGSVVDLDDDEDGISDLVESGGVDPNADADDDGIPNYIDPSYPGFVDTNLDGINDNFDLDLDGVINSLDLDSDNDGILDIIEAGGTDSNNDGEVDSFVDLNDNGITDQYDIACISGTTTIYATSVVASGGSGVVNSSNITGVSDNISAQITMNDDYIIVDMGLVVSSGATITFKWRAIETGAAIMNVYAGLTAGASTTQGCPSTSSNTLTSSSITLFGDARYIKISKGTNSCGTGNSIIDYEVDAISCSYASPCTGGIAILNPDTDGDEVKNFLDLDSDNDDCPDAIEGGATYNYTDIDDDLMLTASVNSDGVSGTGQTIGSSINSSVQSDECSPCHPTNPAFIDTDGDNIGDECDLDRDNDGILNTDEGSLCVIMPAGSGVSTPVNIGNVGDPSLILNAIDNEGASFNLVGETLVVDLGVDVPAGTVLTLTYIAYYKSTTKTIQVSQSDVAGTSTLNPATFTTNDMNNSYDLDYTLTANTQYIKLAMTVRSSGRIEVDYLRYAGFTNCTELDSDKDGITNAMDLDSDNDGIADIIEAGGVDTDGDGRIESSIDTDSDGLMDVYDENNGGDAIANLDTDGDGVKNYIDLDSDNDGIPDVLEAGGTDANNDGLIDGWNIDSDNDGFAQSVDGDINNDGDAESSKNALIITDADENEDGSPENYLRANNDGNGLPNPYDLDADGDGIIDTREAGITDTDSNGIADAIGALGVLGADGWLDDVDFMGNLVLTNSDNYGNPDYLDIDSDDDGIVDNIEGQSTLAYVGLSGEDSDNDGIDNVYDNSDDSFGGNEANGVTPVNTDGDDKYDYADKDADNDGLLDVIEGWDEDGDGEINNGEIAFVGSTDADNDGLFDEYDNDDTKVDPANGTVPGSYPDAVRPGEDRDWREGVSGLPVELYSQDVVLVNTDAFIYWTTATETNNDYFKIERSKNAVDFNEVGIVDGTGNSNILLSYELIDINPLEGLSYYRITQFDFDGKNETFPIMVLNVESTITELKIYPNPAKNYTNIESSIDGELSIISSLGVLIFRTEVIKGQTIKLDTDKFKSGIYLVKIRFADKVVMQKLIIK